MKKALAMFGLVGIVFSSSYSDACEISHDVYNRFLGKRCKLGSQLYEEIIMTYNDLSREPKSILAVDYRNKKVIKADFSKDNMHVNVATLNGILYKDYDCNMKNKTCLSYDNVELSLDDLLKKYDILKHSLFLCNPFKRKSPLKKVKDD